ncbi:MAG: hypothetical protein ACTSYQ_01950 [Candidatus Odinarchaeia archaeon]
MSEDELVLYPLRKKLRTLPPAFKGAIEEILKEGMNRELPDFFEDERDMLDMGEVKTAWKIEEAQKQVQELAKRLGIDKKVGFDWNKKKMKY